MKHLMLAAVASIALALPAMAQTQTTIDPSHLSTHQIRQIQKHAGVRHVDGKWGPRTEAAVKQFQQKRDIKGSGQLNQQTMTALGVDTNGQNSQGSATTGAGSREQRMNQPSQNPGPMNNDRSDMHNGTTGQGSSSMNRGSGTMSGNSMSSGGMSGGANSQNGTSKPSVNDGH